MLFVVWRYVLRICYNRVDRIRKVSVGTSVRDRPKPTSRGGTNSGRTQLHETGWLWPLLLNSVIEIRNGLLMASTYDDLPMCRGGEPISPWTSLSRPQAL